MPCEGFVCDVPYILRLKMTANFVDLLLSATIVLRICFIPGHLCQGSGNDTFLAGLESMSPKNNHEIIPLYRQETK